MVEGQKKRQFDWDPDKSASNKRKHGIDFRQAERIFNWECLTEPDDEYHGELRERSYGQLVEGRVLCVVHTMQGDLTRIISARRATKNEGERYYGHLERTLGATPANAGRG